MKRFIGGLITLMLLLSFLTTPSFALPESAGTVTAPSNVTAKYVVLMDINSQEIIYQKNADQKMYPASTTKLMTAILVLESGRDLQELVTIPASVNTTPSGSSALYIEEGEKYTIDGLMYGLMLKSGNDCAIVLADIIGGGQQAFADMMNAKAAELGMTDTHFNNPHGFHDPNHYTTANDMAKLALYAYKNEALRNYVSTASKKIEFIDQDGSSRSVTVANTNKLILSSNPDYYYKYCTGMKTGFTDEAGQCLVASANKDGQELLAAIFFDVSTNSKYVTAQKLFDYSYERFETINLTELVNEMNLEIDTVNFHPEDENGGKMSLKLSSNEPVYYTSTKEVIEKIKTSAGELTIAQPDKIAAPVSKGAYVGDLTLSYNGVEIFKKSVIAERNVAEKKVIVPDLDPMEELKNAPQDFFNDLIESGQLWLYVALIAVVLLIVIVIVIYRHARKKVSLTRNVYRRERRY